VGECILDEESFDELDGGVLNVGMVSLFFEVSKKASGLREGEIGICRK
jgi:hypothetical protein